MVEFCSIFWSLYRSDVDVDDRRWMWVGLGWAGSPKPIKCSEPPPSVGRSGSENEKAVEQFENEVFLRNSTGYRCSEIC